MQTHDAAAVTEALPMHELLDAVEGAYRGVAEGRDRSPLRTHVALADGDLLLMPGIVEGATGSTVKVVTVRPGNAAHGLPTVQATVLWIDAAGTPRAILDGATLTAMRTGAASGVGTRLLARTDAAVLALLGAGAQAPWQVRAVASARPIHELRVYARTAATREAFAAAMAAELGPRMTVVATATAKDAVRGADIVCCATTSSEPVFDAQWLRPGVHVNGIGAYRPGMVELPPAAFGRAAIVAVDARSAAMAEAGDLLAALEAGELTADRVVELGSIGPEWAAGRDPGAITVFKSVGLAAQDVAAAELAMRRLGA